MALAIVACKGVINNLLRPESHMSMSQQEMNSVSSGVTRLTLFLVVSLSLWIISTPVSAGSFGTYQQTVPHTDEALVMLPVHGGTFSMGSPEDEQGRGADEGPMHSVQVRDFWMSQHEVSWAQYDVFVNSDVTVSKMADSERLQQLSIDALTSATTPYVDMSFGMGKKGYPAVNMTQYAALMYARWLSAQTGHFYRLPTEAEWEYACRAGTETAWSFANVEKVLMEHAVYAGNSNDSYAPIGTGKPNRWQFYNLHGNVAEWTMDAYSVDYSARRASKMGWTIPTSLYPRVARGGSWYHGRYATRCAARLSSSPRWKERDPQLPKSRWWHTNAPFVGFRLVRPRQLPSKEEIQKVWLEAIDDYGR